MRDILEQLSKECAGDGWDGYGAAAILPETITQTRRFMEALPPGTPAPSVGAEPDGCVTLEWHRSSCRTLSVSIAPGDQLHYAALLGTRKAYGTEPFFGDISPIILAHLAEVTT